MIGARFTRTTKRRVITWLLVALAAIALLRAAAEFLLFGASIGTTTVFQEERPGPGGTNYGFSVQKPCLQFRLIGPQDGPVGITVNLWTRRGSRTVQSVAWKSDFLILKNIAEHTWIQGRAVRLGFHVEFDEGSTAGPEDQWLLYDFGSGDLKTCRSNEGTCSDPKNQPHPQPN